MLTKALTSIQRILRPSKDSPAISSSQLQEALEAAEAGLPDGERQVAELRAERQRLLLTGTPADIERIETRLRAAELELERVTAAIPELERQLAAAQVADAQAARDRRIAELRRLAVRGEELHGRYGKLVAELVPVLEEIQSIDQEIERGRKELAGDLAGVPTVPSRQLRQWNRPLPDLVVLPPVADGAPKWGPVWWQRPPQRIESSPRGDEDRQVVDGLAPGTTEGELKTIYGDRRYPNGITVRWSKGAWREADTIVSRSARGIISPGLRG